MARAGRGFPLGPGRGAAVAGGDKCKALTLRAWRPSTRGANATWRPGIKGVMSYDGEIKLSPPKEERF